MGGRIRCGRAGVAWPNTSRRTTGVGAAVVIGSIAAGGGAWAGCMQAHVQPPLQQSGAFWGDFSAGGVAGS